MYDHLLYIYIYIFTFRYIYICTIHVDIYIYIDTVLRKREYVNTAVEASTGSLVFLTLAAIR